MFNFRFSIFDVQVLAIIPGPQGESHFSGANVFHHYHGVQITLSILLEHDVTLTLSSLYHKRYTGLLTVVQNRNHRCIRDTRPKRIALYRKRDFPSPFFTIRISYRFLQSKPARVTTHVIVRFSFISL